MGDGNVTDLPKTRQLNWLKVLHQVEVYCTLVFCIYVCFDAKWKTIFFVGFLSTLGILGVTAGAHRLWAHGSYKATNGLKIFLMLCQTLSAEGSIYNWVRWHRLHHKYFGTDLDPYNPNRGFWYAHLNSLLRDLSPAQQKALEEIDMSDLEEDKIVMWQKKWYYFLLFPLIAVLLPVNAPMEYWGEDMKVSCFLAGWLRYIIILQASWLIHSATRIWGLQAGEKFPADTNLVFLITKSYWLSYHYLAPWDYQTSELGQYGTDFVSKFIRVCAALEFATDLKTVDSKTVRNALSKSLWEQKNISKCLLELSENEQILPEDHYLTPVKYYH